MSFCSTCEIKNLPEECEKCSLAGEPYTFEGYDNDPHAWYDKEEGW